MTKFGITLLLIITLMVGIFLGIQWEKFNYQDACLDLGGGMNPGNYPVCVVEKIIEKQVDMIPVEPDNGIGDGAESLDELLKQEETELE